MTTKLFNIKSISLPFLLRQSKLMVEYGLDRSGTTKAQLIINQ